VYIYILCPHVTYYSTTHNTNIHTPSGIRIRNPSKRSAADPRLRVKTHIQRRGAASSICFKSWKQIDRFVSTN
jgi:hypothetical protein